VRERELVEVAMCQEALECLDMRVCVHVCHVHMYHVCDICDGHVSNEKQSALNYLYGESIPTRLGKGFGLLSPSNWPRWPRPFRVRQLLRVRISQSDPYRYMCTHAND